MVAELSDEQLKAFVSNYRRKGVTEGGIYTLAELLIEQRRRTPSVLGTREVAERIIELSRQSPDGLLSYGDLWQSLRPGSPWKGNATQQTVAKALYRVIGYCVRNSLPILTVVVVRGGSRKLSDQAIQNIFQECRELGVPTGLEPKKFVEEQLMRVRTFTGAVPADDSW